MKKSIACFSLLLTLLACTGPAKESTGSTATADTIQVTRTVKDIAPELQRADSLQVIYYDNPDGDSLRYTRFFTYTETTDTSHMKTLLNELDGIYVQEPKTKPCRSEGKLYLLRGEDMIRTLYFSTRGDSCRYFYFIKDGLFYYFPLTEKAATFLQEQKKEARKP